MMTHTLIAATTKTNIGLLAICTLIGTAIGWGIEVWRKRREIEKLKVEIVNLTATHVVRVHDAHRRYNDAHILCRQCLKDLYSLFKNKATDDEIDEARDNLCVLLFDRALPELRYYSELETVKDDDVSELKELIEGFVVNELRLYAKWIRQLNLPTINLKNRAPVRVPDHHLLSFRKLAKRIPPPDTTNYYRLLDKAIEEIKDAGNVVDASKK